MTGTEAATIVIEGSRKPHRTSGRELSVCVWVLMVRWAVYDVKGGGWDGFGLGLQLKSSP